MEPQPPPAHLASVAGWDTPLGTGYDPESGTFGELCLANDAKFSANAEGYVGSPSQPLTARSILDYLGVRTLSRDSIALDRHPDVQAFVEALAVGPTAINSLMSPLIQSGYVHIQNRRETASTPHCGPRYVDSLVLGARFAYGLRMEFANASVKDAITKEFGVSEMFSLLGREDLEELEDALTGKAEIKVFVLQIGTDPSDLSQVIASSRCSVRELEGCSELLGALQRASNEFFDRLGDQPTAEDYAGWAPMSLNTLNGWW